MASEDETFLFYATSSTRILDALRTCVFSVSRSTARRILDAVAGAVPEPMHSVALLKVGTTRAGRVEWLWLWLVMAKAVGKVGGRLIGLV